MEYSVEMGNSLPIIKKSYPIPVAKMLWVKDEMRKLKTSRIINHRLIITSGEVLCWYSEKNGWWSAHSH